MCGPEPGRASGSRRGAPPTDSQVAGGGEVNIWGSVSRCSVKVKAKSPAESDVRDSQ